MLEKKKTKPRVLFQVMALISFPREESRQPRHHLNQIRSVISDMHPYCHDSKAAGLIIPASQCKKRNGGSGDVPSLYVLTQEVRSLSVRNDLANETKT